MKLKKKELILILLVFLLGISLRSVELLNRNYLFGFDQGREYLAVQRIVLEKKPTLIGAEIGSAIAGLSGIFHGPYFYYLLVIPYILFKGDPYGGLVLMFIFGLASLILCFLFIQRNFGIKMALVAVFLMSLALSAQSRFIWSPHPATFFILLAFWCIFKLKKNTRKYFFLATFFAGLIYGFELGVSVPLIISQFLFVLLILKVRDLKSYLAGFLGVFLSHLPFFAFEARHNLMATRGLYQHFSNLLMGKTLIDYWLLFKNHCLDFWFNFQNTFFLGERQTLWLFIFLATVSLYYLIKGKVSWEKSFVHFLLLLPLVTFAVFMLLNNVVWNYYLIHLHLVYIILFAFYLAKIESFVVKVIFCLFLALMIPGVFKEARRAYNDFYDYGGTAKIKGKIEAIDYLYNDAKGEEFNVLVFTPPVYDYAYRYLLGWYGKKKYGYVPGEEKKGIFYLWIEPDPQKPWTYKGWLETVIKTGKILKEEELSSGFIIQKRYAQD